MQVESFSNNATEVIAEVRTSVPPESNVDLTELDSAAQQLSDARDTLVDVKEDVRDATDGFHGLIIGIAVGAIIVAILGLLCVFVRVRPSTTTAYTPPPGSHACQSLCCELMHACPLSQLAP